MENTITNRQLFFMLFLTLTCYSVVPLSKDMAQTAGTGAWLTILVTALVFGLATVCIVYLGNLHRGQTLLDYAPSLVTKPGAYLLALFYTLYFLFILVYLVTGFSKLLSEDFLPKTPLWSFPLLGIPLFCYIAYKGVTNTARLAEIIGLVFLCTGVLIHILMATEGKVNRILPLFNAAEADSYIESFKKLLFPFFGIEMLFAFPLSLKIKKKPVIKAFLTLIVIGLFYIFIVESCIMKLGINDIKHYDYSIVVAIRDTSPKYLEIISRLDIFYLTVGFGGMIMGISIAMLAVVEYLCRIFKKTSRLAVVISVGAAAYALFLVASGNKGYKDFALGLGPYLVIFSSLICPLILFIIAKAKKRKGGRQCGLKK